MLDFVNHSLEFFNLLLAGIWGKLILNKLPIVLPLLDELNCLLVFLPLLFLLKELVLLKSGAKTCL